jgi:hypothetical protein
MMPEMVEKLAWALKNCNPTDYTEMAEVALTAIREPTKKMLWAAYRASMLDLPRDLRSNLGSFDADNTARWQAMIDTALGKEGQSDG